MKPIGKRVTRGSPLAIFVIGVFMIGLSPVGFHLSRIELKRVRAEADVPYANRQREIEGLLVANSRLTATADRGRTRDKGLNLDLTAAAPTIAVSDRLGALRALIDIFRREELSNDGLPKLSSSRFGIDSNGKLGSDFGEIFGLSAGEFAELQTKLMKAAQQIDEQIASRSTIGSDAAHPLVFEIRPLPEAPALRDGFLGAIRETLGDDRYSLWADLLGIDTSDGPEGLFYSFGSKTYIMAIGRRPPLVGRGGVPMPIPYFIERTVGPPDAVVSNVFGRPGLSPALTDVSGAARSDRLEFNSREELERYLGIFAKNLPANF